MAPGLTDYRSQDRGSRTADPQTFYIGEALAPMLIEAFQNGFQEFILMETEPTPEIMTRYGIPYLVAVRVKGFKNRVTMKGQAVSVYLEAEVYNSNLQFLARFENRGTSDAQKIFARKGGPEVNLNAAIENAIIAMVQYIQDSIQSGAWPKAVTP